MLNTKALALVVLEMLYHYKSMADIDIPGLGQFRPQGHGWQDLQLGLPNIATALGLVSEKKIF